MPYYVTSGQVSNGIILNADNMYVEYQGTANNTTVNSWGGLLVDGGTANYTTVNSQGLLFVEHGTANNTTLRGGMLGVSNGGTANNTTVNSRGYVYVEQGGTATNTTISRGTLYADFDGMATYTTVSSGGTVCVEYGGTANRTTVSSGGSMKVRGGGWATSTTLTGKKAKMTVSSGATVVSAFVNSGGSMSVEGGSANYVSVGSGGCFKLKEGGVATNVDWTPTIGEVSINPATTITFASSLSGVYLGNGSQQPTHSSTMQDQNVGSKTMVVMSGGKADNCSVGPSGGVSVWSGGSVSGLKVSGGELMVYSGGTATDVIWTPTEGEVFLTEGATVSFSSSLSGVYFGSGGTLLSNTAVMSRKTISEDETMVIMSGGTAVSAVLYEGGTMRVWQGGLARSTMISGDGEMLLNAGGRAEYTEVFVGCLQIVSGAVANYTTISGDDNERGTLKISAGGFASNTVIASKGHLEVLSGAIASDTVVSGGGELSVSGGGIVCGLQFCGGSVDVENGGEINFNLTNRKTSDEALVNDMSCIYGIPDYTITVSASQENGTYALANGADGFGETVTISNDRGGSGNLYVGETVKLLEQDYTLNLNAGALTLTITGTPAPELGGIAGDLNMDGRADIIMTIDQGGHPADGATGAWLIQENQTAAWGDLSTRTSGWEIFGMGWTTAGKNTNDVYIRSESNIIGAWTTNNDGKVTGWETVGEFASDAQILGLGDFNGNGQSDLLLRAANGAVGCFFTNGQGWNYFQSLGDEWKLSAIGDFNGDGRDDVVLKHDAGFAGSWLTQADGTPMWADLDTLQDGFEIVGAGDFNGDGTDDVLLKDGGYYGAWLVQNGNAVGWFGIGDLGDAAVEQIADFNGDGKDDLRVRTSAGDLGAQLVMAEDTLDWHYYGSVGAEWKTGLAALS